MKSKFLLRNVFSLLAWIGGFGLAGGLYAAPGDVDLSFDAGSYLNGGVNAVVVQPDGKILIGGSFTTVRGAARNYIARLNADGSADLDFDPGSGVAGIGPAVNCIALQADGKILIGGQFSSVNGTNRNNIARLNADGSPDLGFNPGTGASSYVNSIAVDTNGLVVIGGAFTQVNGTNRRFIARLNANGSLDEGFNPGSGVGGISGVFAVAAQPDGKVLIGGNFTTVNGTNRNHIARLNQNGSLDLTFNPGSGADFEVKAVVLQTDGKVLLGGSFSSINGTNRIGAARLNANGSVDPNFVADAGPTVNAIAVQTNQQVMLGGNFITVNGQGRLRLARVNSDGAVDLGFLASGLGTVNAVALQSDGKIIVGTASGVIRVSPTGTFDATFSTSSSMIYGLNSIVAQPDGKVIVGGNFVSPVGTNIARLTATGSPDAGFGASARKFPQFSEVRAIALQTNGQILVGGNFNSVHGASRINLARLNTNGSLDATFNAGTISGNQVNCIAVQTNGQIVIGGTFFDINGNARNGIARLDFNGNLDNAFNPAIGGLVFSLAVQANGQIVFGTSTAVFRLHNNGTTDGSFAAIPNNTVNAIAIQPDGKVIIGGDFNNFGVPARNYIARLNTNGTLDATFVPASGANNSVKAVALQADGKILIAGNFTSVNGTNRNRIARLNSNGSLDAAFDAGSGADQVVNSMFLQSDGNILLGGQFAAVNATARAFAARLLGDAVAQLQFTNPGFSNGLFRFNISGSPSQIVVVQGSTNLQHWIAIATNSLSNGPVPFSDPQSPIFKSRYYRGSLLP